MNYEVDKKTLQKISLEFRNTASRLVTSDVDDGSDNLKRLINFIDRNPLIANFIQQYASLPEVSTYQLTQGESRGGRGKWNIPLEKNMEIGCTYILLKHAVTENWEYRQLSWGYSYNSNFQDHAAAFNKSVMNPFVGYIVEYLQSLMIDAGMNESNTTTVNLSEGSAYFAGNINQSMLAMGSSTVSGTLITVTSNEQLTEFLRTLKNDLDTVDSVKRDEVSNAIDVLIKSSEGEKIGKSELVRSVEVIGENSPKMKQRLEEIAANAIGGVASTGIVEVIKFVFDIVSNIQ